MAEFLIFVAPFLVLFLALLATFYVAPKDKKSEQQ